MFIACGKVHIVAQPMNEREAAILPTGKASIAQSLKAIRDSPRLTVADRAVQTDINNRLKW